MMEMIPTVKSDSQKKKSALSNLDLYSAFFTTPLILKWNNILMSSDKILPNSYDRYPKWKEILIGVDVLIYEL
ncbi:hypothetical protein R9208_19585 [Flammeovirgaceae bacterium SG7u.132]|nr:hypothetical protein [Flammeovirgaceae bacterium SG7u.132]